MRGRQRADNQPVHPIGTMLSGYSPFGGTPPPPQTHPAMAKITIQPGNNPGKIGAPKPPKLPDKPVLPYMHYSRKVWDEVKQNHPELKTYEIARQIGKNWRDLPDRERKIYENEYQREKQEYYEKMNHYNRSAQYQQYLAAKQRWESAEIKDDDDMFFSMEPVDDVQTDDNAFSHRALCATRFHRNKFFMMDILSESVVVNPMKIMRQEQLDSLSVHRKGLVDSIEKFKKSIEEMKDTHEERKRRWESKSNEMNSEWKRLAEMSPEEYLAEFKAKQEQQRQQRIAEEEEKKKKEAEQAAKKKEEEQEKQKDSDKSEEKPQLENMESKPASAPTETPAPSSNPPPVAAETNEEKGSGNPIEAMHQMVSMAGAGETKPAEPIPNPTPEEPKLTETPMETDQDEKPAEAPAQAPQTTTQNPPTQEPVPEQPSAQLEAKPAEQTAPPPATGEQAANQKPESAQNPIPETQKTE